MAASQAHGLIYEAHLRAAFPGAVAPKQNQWDIEAEFDPTSYGMVTSIKSMKAGTKSICAASAKRQFKIDHPYRLLVLQYQQVGDYKVPTALTEYLIAAAEWTKMLGTLPLSVVVDFDEGLKKLKAAGQGVTARQDWGRAEKKCIALKYDSWLTLNPKSDSTNSRLQCCISLSALNAVVKNKNIFLPDPVTQSIDYVLNGKKFNLPTLPSLTRTRKAKAVPKKCLQSLFPV